MVGEYPGLMVDQINEISYIHAQREQLIPIIEHPSIIREHNRNKFSLEF